MLLVASAGLVLVLVAGLVTWLVWPTPARDRAPFEQAVASLAGAPGLRYTDTSITGQKREITTTQFGEQFGVTSYPGLEQDDQGVLRVGDKLYTKFQRETGRLGKWRAGDPNDESMYGDLIKEYPPPGDLAAKLATALAGLPDLPAPTDPDLPALTIGGVPALRADTPAGTLYVAKDAPYRVLRLEPQGLLTPSRLPSLTALPSLPALPPVPAGPDSTGLDSQGMDLFPIDDAQADQMYDTLAEDTKALSDAVDAGIDFSLTSAATIGCSAAGCTVQASFEGTVSSKTRARITGGEVTAKLTATNVTIDGRPAGGCVSPPATIPITGNTASGQMSCDDPEAGPVFAAVDAEYQARAQQEADATGGTVTLYFPFRADAKIDALAVAQAEVDKLLEQQKQEQDTAACQTRNSTARSNSAKQTLFHYTDEPGQVGIRDSRELRPSLKALNPQDARYGDGQYLSDIAPGTKTSAQLSRCFIGQPFQGPRFTHYVEIDVSGLQVTKGREHVFVIPGDTPLDVTGRIVSWGQN